MKYLTISFGKGHGTPLQYSYLENPMDGGAWWAAVHGVTKSRTWLSDFTFHFHALEKEMATHSSVLAWRLPGTVEPGGLASMGSHRVGHDWSDLAEAAASSKHQIHFNHLPFLHINPFYQSWLIPSYFFILSYLQFIWNCKIIQNTSVFFHCWKKFQKLHIIYVEFEDIYFWSSIIIEHMKLLLFQYII